MTSVRIAQLHKSFGSTPVLRGVDLHVDQGSFTAILGPSGCGKTTLLRLVAGFSRPDAGSVFLGDSEVAGETRFTAPQDRNVGYVPQEGALFPHLNVERNVAFGMRAVSKRAVLELLELVGLDSSMSARHPHELSGGQQQRVAVARALAHRPSVVLLDEPFASLDSSLRSSTAAAVAEALRSTDTTALLVTHDQDEALSLADHVAVMREGRLVQTGTPKEIYEQPTDLGVATFVGSAITLDAELGHNMARTALGEVPIDAESVVDVRNGPGRVTVRPEQVSFTSAGEGVEAVVQGVTYFGHDAIVTVRVSEELSVPARVLGVDVPEPDTKVFVSIRGHCRLL